MIVCNKCGSEIQLNLKSETRIIKGNTVKRLYFPCSACKSEYTYFYSDNYIESVQKQIRWLYARMKNRDEKEIVEHEKKIRKMNQSIKRRKAVLEKEWKKGEVKNGR